MHLVERTKTLMIALGAEWVLWLLVALSVLSVAAIVERLIAMRALRSNVSAFRRALIAALSRGGLQDARAVVEQTTHPAAFVALRGITAIEMGRSRKDAEKIMAAEAIGQRRGFERRFNLLATLGANAPFIGLFGTVIGILQAFDVMGQNKASDSAAVLAPQAIMSSIAEALVCTAVGLGVAIPAVFAFNYFQRALKSAMEDVQMVAMEILAHAPDDAAAAGLGRSPLASDAREVAPRQIHGPDLPASGPEARAGAQTRRADVPDPTELGCVAT